jgi:hypothetical protein
MAIFRRTDPKARADLVRVQSEVARLSAALAHYLPAATDGAGADAGADPARGSMPPLPDIDGLRDRVDEIDQRVTQLAPPDLAARVDAVATQLEALDARITAVSTELANQLGELGNDIDALNNRPTEPIDEEGIEELRDTQLRLAMEQARYQIAFRADLARLAEHLQRNMP